MNKIGCKVIKYVARFVIMNICIYTAVLVAWLRKHAYTEQGCFNAKATRHAYADLPEVLQ